MSTTHLLAVVLLVCTQRVVGHEEDICQLCVCIPPGPAPTQAICSGDSSTDKITSATFTTRNSVTLELIYIYGMQTVNFKEGSVVTKNPVTVLIQNCSNVYILDHSVARLRTLIIRDVVSAKVGVQERDDLWSVVLEEIHQLIVSPSSLVANYSVSIGRIGALNLEPSEKYDNCVYNPQLHFTMFASKIMPIPRAGMSVCGYQIMINSNTFQRVSEGGFQVTAEEGIIIVNNNFQHVTKQAFNLSSPQTFITSNNFDNLPAGALRDVSTFHDTFFTNNTVGDIDLGGVLLDMGWEMIFEQNVIECDCASKRTSILNPKEGFLFLTNSSLEKLQNIFLNNFCHLNCTVTLKTFSYALTQGEVCVKNDTKLEQELLCDITILTTTEVPSTLTNETDRFFVSAAGRVEFLVPLLVIVLTVIITSSVYYGCKEMNSFKYIFNPNKETVHKMTQ